MPFKSDAQRRYLFAKEPAVAKRIAADMPDRLEKKHDHKHADRAEVVKRLRHRMRRHHHGQ